WARNVDVRFRSQAMARALWGAGPSTRALQPPTYQSEDIMRRVTPHPSSTRAKLSMPLLGLRLDSCGFVITQDQRTCRGISELNAELAGPLVREPFECRTVRCCSQDIINAQLVQSNDQSIGIYSSGARGTVEERVTVLLCVVIE